MYTLDNLIFKGRKSLGGPGGLRDHIAADLADISLFPVCTLQFIMPAGCDDALPPVEALADPVISLVTHVYLSVT